MTVSSIAPLNAPVLVTGIADRGSLALAIAREIQGAGAPLVCAGLGPTPYHRGLSEGALRYLGSAHEAHRETVRAELGPNVPTHVLDATLDDSIEELARALAAAGTKLGGVLHAIAFDRTIRGGQAKPLLDVTRDEFLGCLDASAYSLIALVRALLRSGALAHGASVVALSYLGAARVMSHPYRNIGVAKAALERIVRELAAELGEHGIRVNAVRFSPWTQSRAGGAIPSLDAAVASAAALAPLGNASPEALGAEVVHLLRPGLAISGEIRHVDGGYHVRG